MKKDLYKKGPLRNYTRSKHELILRRDLLFKAADILEQNNFPYFLDGGVLLGAYRDNAFIPYDWDIDLICRTEQLTDYLQTLTQAFLNRNFNIDAVEKRHRKMKLVVELHNQPVSLQGYFKEGEYRVRRHNTFTKKIPQHFFEVGDTITFLDRTFPCCGPVEDYLNFLYRDWKTPLNSTKAFDYLHPQHYKEERNS